MIIYSNMHITSGDVILVKCGYVDEAKHWRYSSARDYEGIDGLTVVEKFW